MTFGRVLACIAAVLFAAALSIDASWARANHWLDGHALTTDLISSAFFALLVAYAVSRISRQREAARMHLPAREALHRIVFAGQQASTYLRKLIEERADEIEVAEAEAPAKVAEDDPLDALQTLRSREIAAGVYKIAASDPEWLVTTLATAAELRADIASELIVDAGSTLAIVSDPEAARWALEDAGSLRSIATAARTVASYYRPAPEETVSPMMAALAEAARAELPNLPDDIAAVVRDGIAAEDLDKRLQLENADFRRAAAHRGVKSIALMLAARENLPPSLKTIYAL